MSERTLDDVAREYARSRYETGIDGEADPFLETWCRDCEKPAMHRLDGESYCERHFGDRLWKRHQLAAYRRARA